MHDDDDTPQVERRVISVRALTPDMFGALGIGHIAYVRPIRVDGEAAFAIHAADGTRMGVAPEQAVAFAAIREHAMEPLSLH